MSPQVEVQIFPDILEFLDSREISRFRVISELAHAQCVRPRKFVHLDKMVSTKSAFNLRVVTIWKR